jgi:DNA-binding Xre family transcriptional regulator
MEISPINVQKLLTELWLSGLSDEKIAQAIGTTCATVNRLRHGKHRSTGLERGVKIANLHAHRFSADKEAAA